MLLSGEKVSLRALEPSDLDLIYSWENNPDVWEISHTLVPFSKFVLTQYLKTQHLDIYTSKQLRLVVMDKNSLAIGLIDLFEFEPTHKRAGVGILVDVNSNKIDIKKSIELIFGVKVSAVNVIKVKGKTKRFKGTLGKRSDYKKAIISLPDGQSIDLSAGV